MRELRCEDRAGDQVPGFIGRARRPCLSTLLSTFCHESRLALMYQKLWPSHRDVTISRPQLGKEYAPCTVSD